MNTASFPTLACPAPTALPPLELDHLKDRPESSRSLGLLFNPAFGTFCVRWITQPKSKTEWTSPLKGVAIGS